MPATNLSFASAAAGQNRDSRNGTRTDGRGSNSGEWSRQGRSTNGTLTFRRSSTTPSQSMSQSNVPSEAVPSSTAMPERQAVPPPQYREEMLSIYNNLEPGNVSSLFVAGWNPGHVNGNSTATRGWGNRNDTHVLPQEPDLCWDASASTTASNLRNLTPEERELLATDINAAAKPPQQNTKDGGNQAGGGAALNGRKTSVSQGTGGNFSLASPTSASRPGTRRRETTDTNPFSSGGGLNSPLSARPPREDSFWGRKNTDAKETTFEEPEEAPASSTKPNPMMPFSLMRNNSTAANSGLGAASSIWGQAQNPSTPSATTPSATIGGGGGFGNFALPGATSAIGEKRPGNNRGESRLAHLIPKDSSDSMNARAAEGATASSWRARPRTDTDPFGGEDNLSGSASLGGAQDTSPPPQAHRGSTFDTPVKGSAADFGMAGLNIGSHPDQDHEPLSPSETNPYRSPPGERGEHEDAGDRLHAHGLGHGGNEHIAGPFGGGLHRGFAPAGFDGSDRSQTSSVGAKAYPSLGTLGGWPTSATPDRERNPFGSAFGGSLGGSLFNPMGDLHSPSLGNLNGVFGPPSTTGMAGSGSIGRASKLGSLFPPAMQSQMQAHDNESLSDSVPDLRQVNPLGAIGRNAFGDHSRETESPVRAGRGFLADVLNAEASRTPATSEPLQSGVAATQSQGFPQNSGTPFSGAQPSEPPSAQARTMVMPDRMRWVYLDPQGQQQGPFTGLEMNDWYKANFFTPDLRVKKVEDPEFEPLGQLIRRIGNSREPFLVPQIGIPHGPATVPGPFSSTSGVVQPPLVGAFPSFGRTLTAQEQNDLERRKQEEQYLMAQQRDILSNQQRLARAQLQGHPGLHHHSSAHSLQSQPSFGSIASPVTLPPQAPIGPIGAANAFFGGHPAHQPIGHGSTGLDMFRDREDGLSTQERDLLANLGQRSNDILTGQQSQPPIGDQSQESFRDRLPRSSDLLDDAEGFRARLQEFEQYQAENGQMEQTYGTAPTSGPANGPAAAQLNESQSATMEEMMAGHGDDQFANETESAAMNKQFQQAQAAEAAKNSGLPMPFPPPQSGTPLPAPAPQRVKSNLPEQYATSSGSHSPDATPSSAAAQPPPLAPWAKDTSGSHRGPSLKEIQEAEAKKAAKAEEALAASRRAMAEQEAAREREKAAALASGLPTTSTWGTASPVNTTSAGSPWAKPAAAPKGPAPGLAAPQQSSDKKKTLAEIQREEEVRKQKAKDTAVQVGAPAAAGKRYADLASKPNAASLPASAAASATSSPAAGWATVGAGGKVKIPTGPAATRSVSTTNVKPVAAPAATPKPTAKPAGVTAPSGRNEAMEEFKKWLNMQLTRGTTGILDMNGFIQSLLEMPLEADIIAEIIYGNSKTMNGQHFAVEFIRRKKLAERGVVEKQTMDVPAQSGNAGGWNEVAKKSTKTDASNEAAALPAGFKVVPNRKKGKNRRHPRVQLSRRQICLHMTAPYKPARVYLPSVVCQNLQGRLVCVELLCYDDDDWLGGAARC
ncbi:kinesin-like protein [Apiospora phragmitis]|uniref:Kinesin-like protein n=1 Tax=Apiospora phragmitis TaxID=2905665 RepID=A0ABR1T8N7_9PEZI